MTSFLPFILLNPVLLIPAILTIVLPLRWVLRLWGVIAVIGFGLQAFQVQPSIPGHGGNGIGYALGMAVLVLYGIILSIILMIRLFMRRKRAELLPQEREILRIVDMLLFCGSGLVASFFIFKSMAFWLGGLPYGFFIHCGLSFIFIAAFGAALKLWPRDCRTALFIMTLCSSLSAFSFAGVFYPAIVLHSAKEIAGENPYCIGLNKRGRPLTALEDLAFLTMDKGRFEHHAFLLVEEEDGTYKPYYWAYLKSKFRPGVVNWGNERRPMIPCKPRHDFAQDIKLTPTKLSMLEFYLQARFLRIPAVYAPRLSTSYMSVATQAPDFQPAQEKSRNNYASMGIRSRTWMDNLLKDYETRPVTGKTGNLYETQKEDGTLWYYRLENGMLATVIGCYASRAPETACQHRFYRDGAMYTFGHSHALLVQSDEMEDKLFKLFESFKEYK